MPNLVDYIEFPKLTGRCGYFDNKACTQEFVNAHWIIQWTENKLPLTRVYSDFKEAGFCRFNSQFYIHKCHDCNQCKAIRISVNSFSPSKSQRHAWNRNQDLEVTFVAEPEKYVTEEKVFMLREYDYFHNKDSGTPKKTMEEARNLLAEMNSGYPGIWNMEYRLNGKLIGVAVIDFTTDDESQVNTICSNYFYYDTSEEVRKRSLGVFSVLKEIELCQKMNVPYYYLGLYLADCRKMNYKANYKPYELFVDGKWIAPEEDGGVAGVTPLEGVASNEVRARGKLSPTSHNFTYITLPGAGSYSEEYEDICFISGDIDLDILYSAYKQGIFPWFNEDEGEPVLWQSPEQRFVIFPDTFHVSKSIDKFLKKTPYTYTTDQTFEEIMRNCAAQERPGQNGSWIGPMMIDAYKKLHEAGMAHSYEVWHGDQLVGGFYGVMNGKVFHGESMFTIEPDSSKSAFVLFARDFFANGGKMIDCQCETENMKRYGGINISRDEYLEKLKEFM